MLFHSKGMISVFIVNEASCVSVIQVKKSLKGKAPATGHFLPSVVQ